jgi:hypothetical protein
MHTAALTPILRVPPAALRPPRVSSASSIAPLDVRPQLPRTPPASPSTPLLAPTALYASSSTHPRPLHPRLPTGHAANCSARLRAPRPPRRHPPSIPLNAGAQNLRHVQRPGIRFSAPGSMQRPTVFLGGRNPSLLFLAARVTWRRPSFGFRFEGLPYLPSSPYLSFSALTTCLSIRVPIPVSISAYVQQYSC